jgi:hypothetical protein
VGLGISRRLAPKSQPRGQQAALGGRVRRRSVIQRVLQRLRRAGVPTPSISQTGKGLSSLSQNPAPKWRK